MAAARGVAGYCGTGNPHGWPDRGRGCPGELRVFPVSTWRGVWTWPGEAMATSSGSPVSARSTESSSTVSGPLVALWEADRSIKRRQTIAARKRCEGCDSQSRRVDPFILPRRIIPTAEEIKGKEMKKFFSRKEWSAKCSNSEMSGSCSPTLWPTHLPLV